MSQLWQKLIRPIMFGLDAERAHEIGIKALEMGLASPFYCDNASVEFGEMRTFGLEFPNPIGIAAGFGKNKDVPNEEAVENYLAAFELVHGVADYIAINVSSPNTPGLRDLQAAGRLDALLSMLQERNRTLADARKAPKPLLVKIAPDLSTDEI